MKFWCSVYLIIISLVNTIPDLQSKTIKIECPTYCTCEIYRKLRKASCVNKTIVVADLDIPKQTQILDVSFNQISYLKENVFLKNELTNLQMLNMSHNRLGEINIFAFKGMKKLKVLDLSYNGIQHVFSRWFETLQNLERLYLAGNHFGDMSKLQRYAFNSRSLKVLDLSKSYITFFKVDAFNLPELKELDISNNKLISLNRLVFSSLGNLEVLNIKDNILICNKEILDLKKEIDTKNINFFGDPCKQKKKKFERILIDTNIKQHDEENFWIIEDKDETLKYTPVPQIPCQSFQKDTSMISLSELPYSLFIITVLIYGILIGLVCGCSVRTCRLKHKIRKYRRNSKVRLKHIKVLDCEAQLLTSHEAHCGNSTPVMMKK